MPLSLSFFLLSAGTQQFPYSAHCLPPAEPEFLPLNSSDTSGISFPIPQQRFQKKYEEYLEKIKSYGIKVENKEFYINSLTNKEKIYSKKLLDLNKVKELEAKGTRRIVVENSIVTSSAEEYAKEKNIEIIKRR